MEALLQREAQLKRELTTIQQRIAQARSSQAARSEPSKADLLDLDKFLRALERPASKYLALKTSAQREVFAKETRETIGQAVENKSVSIPFKVKNVRFDGKGKPVIDVDWGLDIPDSKRNDQTRKIWVIALTYIPLNMSKEQAVKIEPGDTVQLNATLGYRSKETIASRLVGTQTQMLKIFIRGSGGTSDVFGNLTMMDYSVTLRKTMQHQSRLLTGNKSLKEQKNGVWVTPSKLKKGNSARLE